jgi:hypothetical protein
MGENAAAAAGRRTTGQKTGFATTSILNDQSLEIATIRRFRQKKRDGRQ